MESTFQIQELSISSPYKHCGVHNINILLLVMLHVFAVLVMKFRNLDDVYSEGKWEFGQKDA